MCFCCVCVCVCVCVVCVCACVTHCRVRGIKGVYNASRVYIIPMGVKAHASARASMGTFISTRENFSRALFLSCGNNSFGLLISLAKCTR